MMYYDFVSESGRKQILTHQELIALVRTGACLVEVEEVPLTWMLTLPNFVNGEHEVLGMVTRIGGICN